MGMLARYKKGGGIMELVKLIEESGEPKRTQLLNMIRGEDAEFAARVESRIFTYASFKQLPENIIAEIVANTPVKFMAIALTGEDAAFVTLCEKCLGKAYNEYKQEKENLAGTPPAAGQIEAARRKVLAEARKLEAGGRVKLMAPEPEPTAQPAKPMNAAPGAAPAAGAAPAGPAGTASADEGCPSVESFKMEAPPPGLMGERLETFFKNSLGLK